MPFVLVSEHIRGEDNVVADALSRDNIDLARSIVQESAVEAEKVPDSLLELLTETSRSWSELEWNKLQGFCSARE